MCAICNTANMNISGNLLHKICWGKTTVPFTKGIIKALILIDLLSKEIEFIKRNLIDFLDDCI